MNKPGVNEAFETSASQTRKRKSGSSGLLRAELLQETIPNDESGIADVAAIFE